MATTKTSAASLILGMASKTSGTAKPKASVVTDSNLDALVDKYLESDRLAKSYKAQADTIRDQLVAEAKPQFFSACEVAGKALSSVKLGKGVITITTNYSTIDTEDGPKLDAVFGEDTGYFKRHIELSVSKEASNNDDFLDELLEKVGVEFFQKNFVVKHGIKVTEAFHSAYMLNPAVREKAQPLINAQVIRPYSPSIRLGK